MSTGDYRGPDQNQEHNQRNLLRETRPLAERVLLSMADAQVASVSLLSMAMIGVFFPAFADLMLVSGLVLFFMVRGQQKKMTLPARMPKSACMPDPSDLHPMTGKPKPGAGITFIGNEIGSNKEVWLTNEDMRTHILMFGTTGSGKAQPLDALVHTPSGWKRMGDIQVGESVSTPDGGVAKVTGVFPQGQKDIYRITFADGRSAEACGEHLWEVHRKHWDGKYKIGKSRGGKCLPRIISTATLIDQLQKNKGSFYVPLVEPIEKPAQDLPIDPYLLGALIGDGDFSGKILRFSSVDIDLVDEIKGLIPESMELHQYPYDLKCDYWIRFKQGQLASGRSADGSYPKSPMKQMLFDQNLLGCGSHEKFIPAMFKNGSIAQRRAVLQGLMDTAGTAGKITTSISFSSLSHQLAKDVQEIVWSLGGCALISSKMPTYSHKGEKRIGRRSFRVSIHIRDPHSLFRFKRKQLRSATYQYADSLKLRIKSIEKIGKKESQCIYVDYPSHLYVTDNYVVTHNTEALLSIAYNSLIQNSGFIYIDGKGDATLWAKISSMVRSMGREDDLLVLNFMTGGRDIVGKQDDKLSNTMNPFATGSSDMLTQLTVGLMSKGGGSGDGDMWQGRAISFVEGLMRPLVYLRDHYGLLLDVNVIREYFVLDRVEDLAWKSADRYPGLEDRMEGLRSFLDSLAGYDRKKIGRQGDTPRDQFGYCTMQLTRTFGSLADTYGRIVRTPLGEIDMYDVVVNRRILVVLLPALEKSPPELSNLGKIIVGSLKSMMAVGLGSKIEGCWEDIIDSRPTNSPSPYVAILDEYGYYAVEGFAVVPAQARSLGFSAVFGAQDLPALQKVSKEEAASIGANTNLKICGKMEDAETTFEFFKKNAGEGYFTRVSGYKFNTGVVGSWLGNQDASIEKMERINIQELKSQRPGEMHLFWGAKIIRARMFYVNPPKTKELRSNHFLRVQTATLAEIEEATAAANLIAEKLADQSLQGAIDAPPLKTITLAAEGFNRFACLPSIEKAIAVLVHCQKESGKDIDDFRASLMGSDRQDASNEPDSESGSPFVFGDPVGEDSNPFGIEQPKSVSIFTEEPEENFGSQIFDGKQNSIQGAISSMPFLDEAAVKDGIERIEVALGSGGDSAKRTAKKVADDMDEATRYPKRPPKEIELEDFKDLFSQLSDALDESLKEGR